MRTALTGVSIEERKLMSLGQPGLIANASQCRERPGLFASDSQ
jgi:hypothetical protein